MDNFEKNLCDDMIRYGTITRDVEFGNVRQYTVIYDGEEYHITKRNGEWIYLHHTIK